MFRRAVLASLLITAACRHSFENEPTVEIDAPPPKMDAAIDAGPSATCLEAPNHSDLAFIEDSVFGRSCVFSSCHDGVGNNGAAKLDLRAFKSHAELVDVDSETDSMASPSGSYKLVVPGQPKQSYLMFLLRHYTGSEMEPAAGQPHGDVGFMPKANEDEAFEPLCIEKREAIVRWIEDGAPGRATAL